MSEQDNAIRATGGGFTMPYNPMATINCMSKDDARDSQLKENDDGTYTAENKAGEPIVENVSRDEAYRAILRNEEELS